MIESDTEGLRSTSVVAVETVDTFAGKPVAMV